MQKSKPALKKMKNEIVIIEVWNVAMNSRLNLRKKAIPITLGKGRENP